jgi:hypothetical protein
VFATILLPNASVCRRNLFSLCSTAQERSKAQKRPLSRAGAVGNVLAAVLTLIGGLNIYVFGTDNKHKALVAYCASLFAFMLFYGTQTGAYIRESDREARLIDLTSQEIRIRTLRKNLGLPDDFPDWIISTEPK